VWEQMPTFVLCEWSMRLGALVALYHAIHTDRKKSWLAAVSCGTANDIFFMFMPFCDNFWQAQASVMITPRLPLYIVEMYACVMYFPAVASSLFSRSMAMSPVAQACLTGLLAHLFYGVYDDNGPRYLWWTWHDGDPAISPRLANAPIGSSMWILTFCGLHSLINSWILRGKGARLTGCVAPSAFDMSASSALVSLSQKLPSSFAQRLLSLRVLTVSLDKVQDALGLGPDAVQIFFRMVVTTPLFMVVMGQIQVMSLDQLGIPGKRSYFFTLAVMIAVVIMGIWNGRSKTASKPMPANHRRLNRLFLAFVMGHFLLHSYINLNGQPELHWSTGIHQKVRSSPEQLKDIMGWPREEQLPPTGPHIFSQYDYGFKSESDVKKPLAAIDAQPVDVAKSTESQWYTIFGKRHKDRDVENGRGILLAVLGAIAFCVAMGTHL